MLINQNELRSYLERYGHHQTSKYFLATEKLTILNKTISWVQVFPLMFKLCDSVLCFVPLLTFCNDPSLMQHRVMFFYCTFVLDCSVQVNCPCKRFTIKFRFNELLKRQKTCSSSRKYAAKIHRSHDNPNKKSTTMSRVGNADSEYSMIWYCLFYWSSLLYCGIT